MGLAETSTKHCLTLGYSGENIVTSSDEPLCSRQQNGSPTGDAHALVTPTRDRALFLVGFGHGRHERPVIGGFASLYCHHALATGGLADLAGLSNDRATRSLASQPPSLAMDYGLCPA